jgi:hypothetical protein
MNECANSGSKLLAGPPVENRVIVVTSHSKELSANVKSTSTSANVEPIFRPAKKLMMKRLFYFHYDSL